MPEEAEPYAAVEEVQAGNEAWAEVVEEAACTGKLEVEEAVEEVER